MISLNSAPYVRQYCCKTLVGSGQVFLWSNHIARFLDYQCFWKGSIDILDFLHGVNHQEKVPSETASFLVGCG